MALSANVIWQKRGGSDSAGGGFDPSLTTNMFTDLVIVSGGNTASPVVSSALFTTANGTGFTTLDVGHWLFIATTTNGWYGGWYQIASVSGGAATLKAAVTTTTYTTTAGSVSYTLGQAQSSAPLQTGGVPQTYALNGQFYTNTTAGCSSFATQSTNKATWAIDRSRVATIFDSGTVATAATTAFTRSTDVLGYTPGRQDIGNILNLISGTGSGFVASMYAITNGSSTGYTLDRTQGSAAATAISWSLGGSFVTIGGFGLQFAKTSVGGSGQRLWANGLETLMSTTVNVSGGPFSSLFSIVIEGFNSVCGDLGPGAYVSAGSQTTFTIFTESGGNANIVIRNIVIDCNNGAAVVAFTRINATAYLYSVLLLNGASGVVVTGSAAPAHYSYAYKCLGTAFNSVSDIGSIADSCGVGFTGGPHYRCVAMFCTTGFNSLTPYIVSVGQSVAYGCTSHGVVSPNAGQYTNVVSIANGGVGFSNQLSDIFVGGNAGFGNTSGNLTANPINGYGFVISLTSNPYAGNHIGGGVDLVVDATNNTWVTSTTVPTIVSGSSPTLAGFTAADIGLKLVIYGGTGYTPGIYTAIGFDSGTNSLILNFSPAAVGTTGGKYRIADFRPNNVVGGGAALRGTGIGAIGQVDAIDIGAVQHPGTSGGGGGSCVIGSSVIQGCM